MTELLREESIWRKILRFCKKNAVMLIAFVAAAVTCCIVPFDKQYLEYFDYKTLTCLFCTLAVVCAFKNINFFYMLAHKVVRLFKNLRLSVLALVYITFLGSMLIANDMALLTFLPLGYIVLTTTGKEKYMAFTFVMQNVAANLGGMLTPFGNPQNLYLYSYFNIPTGEFLSIMAVPFAIAIVLITVICLIFVKPEPLAVEQEEFKKYPVKTVIYSVLFVLSVIIVFRLIPYWIGLIVVPIALLFIDRKALLMVDYPLLLTFVFFFIFAGNMARIEAVRSAFSYLLQRNTLIYSILSCQVISNVPSAILLSQFTQNYRELLLGVNIGGVGTLIASLASLITFKEYNRHNTGKALYYIGIFSLINFSFLIIITGSIYLIQLIF